METTTSATRLIVISDLHLGGEPPCMMSQPVCLKEFIDGLPERLAEDEQLELVVAGDVVDFLAVPDFQSWTVDAGLACKKLRATVEGDFAPFFEALALHLERGHRLTVMLGNHDLELALPQVQAAFLEALKARPHDVIVHDDGRAYRSGGVLIEHGNRYDGANVNDWDRLRTICSAQSRDEPPPVDLRVSAGSVIVEKVVSPLKSDYPFIDLLQPAGELLALLILAFEPKLGLNWGRVSGLLKGQWRQGENPEGYQPGRTWQVGAEGDAEGDAELEELFGERYRDLRSSEPEVVGAREWLDIFNQIRQGSLAQLIKDGKAVPPKRLRQIQTVMRRLAASDHFRDDGDTGPYGAAAKRLLGDGVEVVVMGHTHLARHVGAAAKATYINTGTWADVVRVPDEALADADEALEALEDFLGRLLCDDGVRRFLPTYADIRLAVDGSVDSARLRRA